MADNTNSSGTRPRIKLLVIDDDEIHREVIHRLLDSGFDICGAETGVQALKMLATQPVDCLLLDFRLPDYNAIELLEALAAPVPVVVFSAYVTPEMDSEIHESRGFSCLQKDQITAERLLSAISSAIDAAAAQRRT